MEKSLIFKNETGEFVMFHECKDGISVETNIPCKESYVHSDMCLGALKLLLTYSPIEKTEELITNMLRPLAPRSPRCHMRKVGENVRLCIGSRTFRIPFNTLYMELNGTIVKTEETNGLVKLEINPIGPKTIIPVYITFPQSEYKKLLNIAASCDVLDISIVNQVGDNFNIKGTHCNVNGKEVFISSLSTAIEVWGLSWSIPSKIFK